MWTQSLDTVLLLSDTVFRHRCCMSACHIGMAPWPPDHCIVPVVTSLIIPCSEALAWNLEKLSCVCIGHLQALEGWPTQRPSSVQVWEVNHWEFQPSEEQYHWSKPLLRLDVWAQWTQEPSVATVHLTGGTTQRQKTVMSLEAPGSAEWFENWAEDLSANPKNSDKPGMVVRSSSTSRWDGRKRRGRPRGS